MRNWLALGAVLALLGSLAACADEAGEPGTGGDDAAISITIEIRPDAEVEPTTYTLTCDPTGGDHPRPADACAALGSVDASAFDPVPADQACTMIYGGPQEARVFGTFAGEEIDATFTYTNGCEIARWDALGPNVLVLNEI